MDSYTFDDYSVGTPLAEYSSVVTPDAQASSNSSGVSTLNGFLTGLASLAQPVATIVNAVQSPKTTTTTNTGDGQKTMTPTSTTVSPTSAQSGVFGMDSKTLMIAGAALVGVLVLVMVAKK